MCKNPLISTAGGRFPQPPPESECIPFEVAEEKVFRHTFSHRFLMWGIYFKQIALVILYIFKMNRKTSLSTEKIEY